MGKDLSQLREAEAEAERERVARLKTEQELGEEKQRTELAEMEAKQRETAETEARKKEEDLIKLRESREAREAQGLKRSAGERKYRETEFKEQLKGTQETEEEQRRRFLERVEAQAEGREPAPATEAPLPAEVPLGGTKEGLPLEPSPLETPPLPADLSAKAQGAETEAPKPSLMEPPLKAPIPPKERFKFPKIPLPSLKIPKVSPPKISGYFPSGPSLLGKLWIKIIVSLLVFTILAAVATFWYWYFIVRKETTVEPQSAPPVSVPPVVRVETLPITKMILDQGYRIPEEPRVVDTIIVHSVFNAIGGDPYSAGGVIKEYQLYKVAAHYLVDQGGRIYQTAPLEAITFHAGKSQMPDGRVNVNDFSIGIELIYKDSESPNEAQYQALAKLIKYLRQDYEIPDENILGHKDIAPSRKTDPWNFDWQKVENLWKN